MRIRAGWATAVVAVAGALASAEARADDGRWTPSAADAAAQRAAMPVRVPVQRPAGDVWLASQWADGPPAPPTPPRTEPGVDVVAPRPTPTFVPPAPVGPPEVEYPAGGGWSPTGLWTDTRLGPASQPEWTTDRRWARVRAYVLPPGQVEFESWYRGEFKKHDAGDVHQLQEEVSIGLPHRLQLDFYLNFEDTREESMHYIETQLEMRYALADWDCLWGNPTLYLEYRIHEDPDESDAIEAKLLLSDDLAPKWRWGANLIYERELKNEQEETMGLSAALSYTVCDRRLEVGAEAQFEHTTVLGARDDPEYTFYFGPSVQFRFGERTHLDVAPLFGLTDDSDKMRLFIVFGIDIGPDGANGGWLNPISAASR